MRPGRLKYCECWEKVSASAFNCINANNHLVCGPQIPTPFASYGRPGGDKHLPSGFFTCRRVFGLFGSSRRVLAEGKISSCLAANSISHLVNLDTWSVNEWHEETSFLFCFRSNCMQGWRSCSVEKGSALSWSGSSVIWVMSSLPTNLACANQTTTAQFHNGANQQCQQCQLHKYIVWFLWLACAN